MPRDQRLYMTFPIDFDEHPKVMPLTDAAFRAFVEMNGYSRRQSLDGVIPEVIAHKRWKPRVLRELVESHPERPLVLHRDGAYVIRDYSEHQFTNSDIEALREKRAEAGRKGGKAKANALALAKQKGGRDQSLEIRDQKTDDYYAIQGSHLSDARAELDRDWSDLGVSEPERVVSRIAAVVGDLPESFAVDVTRRLLESASTMVLRPEAYVEACDAESIERAFRAFSWPEAVSS